MNTAYSARPVSHEPVDYDPFAGGELSMVVPTTESQREIWLADQLDQDASRAFNLSVSLRLHGRLDVECLRLALQELVDRHDALRASVGPDGESFCVMRTVAVPMPTSDLRGLEARARADAISTRLRNATDTPFSLATGPLFRAELLRVADDEHLLLLTAHHIACDGWSWRVVARDLGAVYAYRSGFTGAPVPEPVDFAQYALAEASEEAGKVRELDEAFWLSRFCGEVPVLELPTDHPRPARRSFVSSREDYELDAALLAALRNMSSRRGASLFSALLAGFSGLLSRLSGRRDVVVGIPAAGQPIDGYDNLVGHCVNLLPLRLDVDPSEPFGRAIDAVQAGLIDALEHQHCTFGTLLKKLRVARDPARTPLVSVLFNLEQVFDQETTLFPGLRVELESNPRAFETFELYVNAVQVHSGLRLECQYNRDLYDGATVRRWLRALETLLRAAVERESAELGRLPLLDAVAQAELASLQPAPVVFDRECRMHEHFEAQCDRTPDRTALRCGDLSCSYAELEARANRIADCLRGQGVRRGTLVGLALDRSIDMVAALLGVLKSGAGYVPLDPKFPHDRLAYMAADAGLALLLTSSEHASNFDLRGRPVLELDQMAAQLSAAASHRIGRDEGAAEPEGIAYVIYTSGSTGRPKGVQVPHRAVANFLTGMQREPGLCADDRLLAVTTLSFDIAVLELMLPLSVGAEIVLADRETVGDGMALAALLAGSRATAMQGTPSTWRMLLDAGWGGSPGFKALCGGETLAPDLAGLLLPRCGELWNLYGPTETTVWSTCARIVPTQAAHVPDISIGRPIANTRVWVLDSRGELCPRGVPGEICIGGEGVTLGYLDRPALTSERFIQDRFGTELHAGPAVLYRTGDRGRWRIDGQLEHQGRLDSQVKIRGYRIELGEVENTLAQHPGVARVTAIVREDRPGDVRLVAYVVPLAVEEADEAGWIAHLRGQLPEYMVPQHFICLEAMPLLPNGKIDRKSLPAPTAGGEQGRQSRAPRNETERRIATIMADVLGLPAVGVDDDFFSLGGHSLLGARLLSRLGQALGVRLPLRTLFQASTVARLAEMAAAAMVEPGAQEDVPRHADQSIAPLSLMQQRLWVQEQIEPGLATYNIASAYRLCGSLDVHALESALGEVVRRQSTLRTELVTREEGGMQRVHEHLEVALPLEDLSALPPGQGEAEAMRRMVELSAQPIPMEQVPLFRVHLYRLSADRHLLFFMVHHAIWDGMSQGLFRAEMAALYEANTEGRTAELPQPTRSYVDFVHWHLAQAAKPEMQKQLAHWKEHLAGDLEPLHLPEDRPRPTLPTGQGGSELVQVDGTTLARLRQVGAGADASLFMTLLAAYFVWLHRMTGQQDLVVGVPVRNHVSEAMDQVMGFFVNILPLRVHVDPALSFLQLLERVRQAVLDCFTHPDVPLETLVSELGMRRDPSRSPIYQAVFSFEETGGSMPRWGALSCEQVFLPQATANNDLSFWCFADTQGLTATLNYNTDIILAASAERMGRRFEALLASLPTDLDTAVGDVNFLSEEDRNALERWNATTVPMRASATLHAMLAEQFRATPDADAIHFGGHVLTYAQLNARTEHIASALAARGVAAGDLVGVCLGRHADLVATLIGVLVAGAAYVPLDPAYPPDRLRFMAEDAGLALVVSEGELAEPLRRPREKLLLLDADATQIDSATFAAGFPSVGPEALAYVIYTSGSTGKPKGVRVPHGAVVNFLGSMRREPGIVPSDRLVAVTTTSFDIAVLELFLPLTVGASVVIASREQVFEGAELARLLTASNATMMQATPSVWRLLLDSGWVGHTSFKALCGGEPLPVDLAEKLFARGFELWNMYGPTETTVWSTCANVRAPVQDEMPDIHIGHPIDNTTVWVLDPRGQPCPPGVPGEIYIGGAGVTLGYHERPELTAERFVADRFSSVAAFADSVLPPRLYRTGDRGRWRHDGMLKHEGRLDFQVKLRGHRIEPGEIESCLASCTEIARAAVIVREDQPNDQRLVAYVVAKPACRIDEKALRIQLRGILPAYMVPQHIVVLDALPLLPNGKLDRNALPLPLAGAGRSAIDMRAEAAATDIIVDPRVRYLAGVWSELIGTQAGAFDNFFDIGGNSMLAVQMANRVSADTGVRIKLVRLASHDLESIASELPKEFGPATRTGRGAQLLEKAKRMFGAHTG